MSMPNRTLCDTLKEMRTCCETLNFSPILGLIHEVQILGNRMEAALYDKTDMEYYRKQSKELKVEIKELEEQIRELEVVVGKVPDKKIKRVRSVLDDIMGE